jgi:hypothetical protein
MQREANRMGVSDRLRSAAKGLRVPHFKDGPAHALVIKTLLNIFGGTRMDDFPYITGIITTVFTTGTR